MSRRCTNGMNFKFGNFKFGKLATLHEIEITKFEILQSQFLEDVFEFEESLFAFYPLGGAYCAFGKAAA